VENLELIQRVPELVKRLIPVKLYLSHSSRVCNDGSWPLFFSSLLLFSTLLWCLKLLNSLARRWKIWSFFFQEKWKKKKYSQGLSSWRWDMSFYTLEKRSTTWGGKDWCLLKFSRCQAECKLNREKLWVKTLVCSVCVLFFALVPGLELWVEDPQPWFAINVDSILCNNKLFFSLLISPLTL
jgi:hypothetical protein